MNGLVYIIEGSLEVKLPTIWTDEKQSWAEAESEEDKSRREKSQRREESEKEDADARKGRKSRNTVFCQ